MPACSMVAIWPVMKNASQEGCKGVQGTLEDDPHWSKGNISDLM